MPDERRLGEMPYVDLQHPNYSITMHGGGEQPSHGETAGLHMRGRTGSSASMASQRQG